MQSSMPRPKSAYFHNTAATRPGSKLVVRYPMLRVPRLSYDLLFKCGDEWVYSCSSNYPQFIGFQWRERAMSLLGHRWMVIEAQSGEIYSEGGPSDTANKSRAEVPNGNASFAYSAGAIPDEPFDETQYYELLAKGYSADLGA